MIDIKKFRKEKNITQKTLQDLLDLSQSYISSLENGVKPVTEDIYEKLIHAYGDDILQYKMTERDITNISEPQSHYRTKQQNTKGVPYYDIDVTGTITGSFSDIKELPEFHVDFKPFNDCAAYLPIYGDSMYPQFCSGEIIAIKEWVNKDVILWGEPYLVITNAECNSLRTIKLIYPGEDHGSIILRASNPNFRGDTVVPKNCVVAMYIIKGKITRKQL